MLCRITNIKKIALLGQEVGLVGLVVKIKGLKQEASPTKA